MRRPLAPEVVAAGTVATVATVVVGATAATVVAVIDTGEVGAGKAGAFRHLSFLPTLVQIRGLVAEPPMIPARAHLPPTLAADTCWVGTMIAKTLATITAIILKDLNIG